MKFARQIADGMSYLSTKICKLIKNTKDKQF